MRPDHLSYTRLLKAAVLGAVIGVIFDLAVTLATSPKGLTGKGAFSIVQVPSAVAFLLVGFAAGWLFKLFKAQTEVTDQSLQFLAETQKNVERCEGINEIHSVGIETHAGYYLEALREKPMTTKTRLVLVDDDDLEAMQQDLADPAVMSITGNTRAASRRIGWVSATSGSLSQDVMCRGTLPCMTGNCWLPMTSRS